ncbi:MAG TPA: hypothetical protein VEY30_01660 [Myxococcaceae bacterium]|nr:hypothetical protein [Myxococcaceae bacterium]
MSDVTPNLATEPVPPVSAGAAAMSAEAMEGKRLLTEQVLADILRRMDWPARLELRDGEDGGIAVALHSDGEAPGVQPGRRSYLIDSLQLIANKIVNRLPGDRRWISIGVGGFPTPRVAAERTPKQRPAKAPVPPAAAPVTASVRPQAVASAAPVTAGDERTLEVSADPKLAEAVRALGEKSAALGRFYAIVGMRPDDRARVVQAARGMAGVTVGVEGEGRQRRILFTPEKPVPMPKRTLPVDDDEEFDEA